MGAMAATELDVEDRLVARAGTARARLALFRASHRAELDQLELDAGAELAALEERARLATEQLATFRHDRDRHRADLD